MAEYQRHEPEKTRPLVSAIYLLSDIVAAQHAFLSKRHVGVRQ